MAHAVKLAVVVAMVALAVSGCARPRLASRPLTAEQMEWSSIIRTSYRGWQPPHYSTVVTRDPNAVLAPAAIQPVQPTSSAQLEFVPAEPAR